MDTPASSKKAKKEKKKARKSIDADAKDVKPSSLSESSIGALPWEGQEEALQEPHGKSKTYAILIGCEHQKNGRSWSLLILSLLFFTVHDVLSGFPCSSCVDSLL
jgi:hypothetical protein